MEQRYTIELIEEHEQVNFTSKFIASRIKSGAIVLVDKEILGNLNFVRNEKK